MALVKDKKGLLSADVEIPNYKNAVFIDSLNTLRSQNKRIAEMYRTGAVFRLGGEWLIDRYFVRAGLALLSSPFAKSVGMTDATQASQSVCFGAGYRGSQWNLDAGYGYTFTQEAYTPYALEQANNFGLVYNKVGFGKLLVTVVRRF
jgi:hypothetical protein